MNRALTDHFVSSFREDAPRPPVPGEEGDASCPSPGKLAVIRHHSQPKPVATESLGSTTRRNEDGLGEPEGSASPDSPLVRWTKSLLSLLGDRDGAQLFRTFLEREKCIDTVDFWFACNGFRQMNIKDTKTLRVAKAIYKRYIENNSIVSKQLKTATKVYIRDNIRKQQIESSMFDQAQIEIQATMEENAYQMFLTSNIYLDYVRAGCENPTHINQSGLGSLKLMCGYLPTLNEEEEWTGKDFKDRALGSVMGLSTKAPQATSPLRSTGAQENGYGLFKHNDPPEACRVSAGYTFAPASSTHDSGTSSDALTDDSMSVTDSSVEGVPPYKLGSRKLLTREMHRSVKVNGHISLPDFPRAQWSPKDVVPVKPAVFAAQLIARLEQLKHDQETRSSLEERLQQIQEEEEREEVEAGGSALCDEDPQAILDEHLSRVLRTPGCQSPRTGVGVARRCLSPDAWAPCRSQQPPYAAQQGGPRGREPAGEGAEGACRWVGPCPCPKGAGLSMAADMLRSRSSSLPRRPCRPGEVGALGACGGAVPQPPADGTDRSHTVWQWILDSERQGRHRSHSAQGVRRPHAGDSSLLSAPACTAGSGHPRAAQPFQPFVQDPCMPPLPPPNTLAQLEEARRRLEEASRAPKPRCSGSSLPRVRNQVAIQNNSMLLASSVAQSEEFREPRRQAGPMHMVLGPELIVTYFFCGEEIPYRWMVRSHSLTLGHFKEQLRKKGDYRYYFKKASDEFECGAVFEEVWEDGAVLPMYDGKILGKVERMD